MTIEDVIAALGLPDDALVEQRVAKRLLIEHGAPTPADKRQINDGIEELLWLAALKPTTIGVPEYRDDVRTVLEIAVLSLVLRPDAQAGRLTELIHRSIPYPVMLVATQSDTVTLSLARKRASQTEAGKVVLEDAATECRLEQSPSTALFLNALNLTQQPRIHLFALYQGWIACVEAYLAAQLTGQFAPGLDAESAAARRAALADHDRLVREISQLRAQAKKEKQISRRVDLNLTLKRLEAELAERVTQL